MTRPGGRGGWSRGARPARDTAEPDAEAGEYGDGELAGMRAVWLSMRDEEPSGRGMAELLAAARVKATAMAPRPRWWQRLAAVLRRPPVLALAIVLVLIGGGVLLGHRVGEKKGVLPVTAVSGSASAPAGAAAKHAELDAIGNGGSNRPGGGAGPAPRGFDQADAIRTGHGAAPLAEIRDADRSQVGARGAPPGPASTAEHRAVGAATAARAEGAATGDAAAAPADDASPGDPGSGDPSRVGGGVDGSRAPGRAGPEHAVSTSADRDARAEAPAPPAPAPARAAPGRTSPPERSVVTQLGRAGDARRTPLYQQCEAAARRGDCAEVRRLLEQISQTDPGYRTRVTQDAGFARCLE